MDKEAIKAALGAMKPAELKDQAPALYDAVIAEAPAPKTEELADARSRADKAEVALADAVKRATDAEAKAEALQAIVDQFEADKARLEAEKAENERVLAIEDAVTRFCEGKTWSVARAKFLRRHLLADKTRTAADVQAVDQQFEEDFGQYLTDSTPEAGQPPSATKDPKDPEIVRQDSRDEPAGFAALPWSRPRT